MKTFLTTLTAFSLAAACQTASAVTILDLEGGTAGTQLDGTITYTEDGYLLEYWAGNNPVFVDTGSNLALGDSVPAGTPWHRDSRSVGSMASPLTCLDSMSPTSGQGLASLMSATCRFLTA